MSLCLDSWSSTTAVDVQVKGHRLHRKVRIRPVLAGADGGGYIKMSARNSIHSASERERERGGGHVRQHCLLCCFDKGNETAELLIAYARRTCVACRIQYWPWPSPMSHNTKDWHTLERWCSSAEGRPAGRPHKRSISISTGPYPTSDSNSLSVLPFPRL